MMGGISFGERRGERMMIEVVVVVEVVLYSVVEISIINIGYFIDIF